MTNKQVVVDRSTPLVPILDNALSRRARREKCGMRPARYVASIILAGFAMSTMAAGTGFLDVGGNISTIRVPGSFDTHPMDINNNGWIVGTATDSSRRARGFLYDGSSFTAIDIPGATSTGVQGINDAGDMVGGFLDSKGVQLGYIATGTTITHLAVPGARGTFPADLNNAGVVVGSYDDPTTGLPHGFAYDGVGFRTYDFPGARYTLLTGINDVGQMSGYFWADQGPLLGVFGFVDDGGVLTLIDANSPLGTLALGINDDGHVVGWFSRFDGAWREHGFLFEDSTLSTIDVPSPDPVSTQASGINDAGHIVGYYYLYPLDIPEPSSLVLLIVGLLALPVAWLARMSRGRGSPLGMEDELQQLGAANLCRGSTLLLV